MGWRTKPVVHSLIRNPSEPTVSPTESPTESQDIDTRRRRALYRAEHRGTKEMDLVLGPYAKARLAEMPEASLTLFEALLLEPDPELQEMFLGVRQPAEKFLGLVREIRAFHGLPEARH